MQEHDYAIEAAFASALTAVAIGEEYDRTRRELDAAFPSLTQDEIDKTLQDALHEAQEQGVEREDIDPSWLA